MKRLLVLLTLLLAGVGLAACQFEPSRPDVGSITIDELGKTAPGENFFFSISITQARLDAGQPISIQTSGDIKTGQVHTVLRDPEGVTVWDPGGFGGKFTANTYYRPKRTGHYSLGLTWDGPASGSYALAYQNEMLTLAVLVPGLGMLLVAAAFLVWALRRGATWAYLGLGALAWVVTVAVKFAIAILANPPVQAALFVPGWLLASGSLLFYLYIGALTGVTEVLLTWLLLRYTRMGRVPWSKVLAFGVGFGAVEALLLGLSSIAAAVEAIIAPQAVSAAAFGSLFMAGDLVVGLAPIIERAATILVHMLCAALLFYGVRSGQSRWLWVAFAWKTLLDAVAGFAQMWGLKTSFEIWTIETVILLFGLGSWWGLRRLVRMYNDSQAAGEITPQNAPA